MKTEYPFYSDRNFSRQLKKFRHYRGYITQATLCKMINVSRQVWSLWELNKRKPTLLQLIDIANCLEVELSYFFITDAAPEDYDLTINQIRKKIEKKTNKHIGEALCLMPFIPTITSRQIFKALDQCKSKQGIYAVTVYADSGITRAIQEYANLSPGQVYVMDERFITDSHFKPVYDAELVVIENADKLPDKFLIRLVTTFARETGGSIILCGKKILAALVKAELLDRIHEQYRIDCITSQDFNNIAKAALPEANEAVLNFLRIETGIRLKRLFEIIKKIDVQKKNSIHFNLTINTLIKLGL